MKVDFKRLTWENYPSTETPINADNLNRLEEGVAGLYSDMAEIEESVDSLETFKDETSAQVGSMQTRVTSMENGLPTMVGNQIDTKFGSDIGDNVTTWLTEHVTPSGSAVVVDDTLSIEGAAADAKKTGDELTSLKEDSTNKEQILKYYSQEDLLFSEQGYVKSDTGVIIQNANYNHTDYIEIKYQNKIVVQCGFAYDAGIAFYDIDKNYISGFRASTNDFGGIEEVIIPNNTFYYRICQNINSNTYVWCRYRKEITDLQNAVNNKLSQCALQPVETAEITSKSGYYSRTGFHSGDFISAEYNCNAGEKIMITCSGNASFAGYYFYDANGFCIEQGTKDKKFTDFNIVVPINAVSLGLNKLEGTEGTAISLSVKKAGTENPYIIDDIIDTLYSGYAWHRLVEESNFSGVYVNNTDKFVENGTLVTGYVTKIYDVSDIQKIRFSGNPYVIGFEDYSENTSNQYVGDVTDLEIDVKNYSKFFVSGTQATFYGTNYNRVDGYFPLNTKWTDKKIVWFGTSIPAGGYKGLDNPTSYPSQVGYKLGANVINEAVGTSCIVCRDPDRVSATNPYGFHNIFESASRCLTNTIEMMEWISNWADYYCNGGTYQNEEEWDETIFTQMLPTTWDASKRADIISFSYENKLDQYLTKATEPDLFVFDHGYNDTIRWRDNQNKYEEYLPTYGSDACFTFRGSMNFLLRRILSFDPHVRVVMIGDYGNQNEDKKYDSKYQMIVAEDWELPLYKEWENTGWSLQQITTDYYWNNGCWTKGSASSTMSILATWIADGVHPHSDKTGNANRLITELISEWLLTE